MKEITYTCRFCKQTRSFETDTSGAEALGINIEKWIENICCDRCGKFHIARSQVTEKVGKACFALRTARYGKQDDVHDAESVIMEKLNILTKKLAQLVCDHYQFSRVWESEFVSQLMDRPTKFDTIIRVYIKGIASMPRGES